MGKYFGLEGFLTILFIGGMLYIMTFGSPCNSEKTKQNVEVDQESIKDSVGIANFIKSTNSIVFDSTVSISNLSYQQDTILTRYLLEARIDDIYISGLDTIARFKVDHIFNIYWFDLVVNSDLIAKLDIESSNIIAAAARYSGKSSFSETKETSLTGEHKITGNFTLREFKYSGKLTDVYVK